MIISCDDCAVRDLACGDCVVTHFLALPGPQVSGSVEISPGEDRALRVLQGSGLLPPLRLAERPEWRASGA